MTRRFPVGKCPSCKHPLIYSNQPSTKWGLELKIADDNFQGRAVLCAKCKKMIAIIDHPTVVRETIALPH